MHYVIESMAAYEAAKVLAPDGSHWWTTSPSLYEQLRGRGESVGSLEEDIDPAWMDALAEAGYDFTSRFGDRLNECCIWREYADIKLAISYSLNQSLFATLYKAMLLQRLRDRCRKDETIVCVGDPLEKSPMGLGLLFHRFDTIYAMLARREGEVNFQVFSHETPKTESDRLTRYTKNRPLSKHEKILSLLNNTIGAFLFNILAYLKRHGLYPFQNFALYPWRRKHFYIYQSCELIDELAPSLLVRGGAIGFIPPLPVVSCIAATANALPERMQLESDFTFQFFKSLAERNIDSTPALVAAEGILRRRFFIVLERLYDQFPLLNKEFERITSKLRLNGRIITNALTSIEERLFANHCAKVGVEVTAVEHGLTFGLSRWSSMVAQHAGMLAATSGIYHTEQSRKEIARHAHGQHTMVGGLPIVTQRVLWKPVQRRLGRRLLGLKKRDHVVLFVANLDRNNYIYGPGIENDLEHHNRTRAVMEYLLRSFPESVIVLKLYPAARYLDQWDWPEFAAHPNVRVVRDADFRFIRATVDVIFVATSQSTLGWCLGAGAPVFYIEPEHAPVTFSGCRLGAPGIAGVRSIRYLTLNCVAPQTLQLAGVVKELFQ